MQSPGHMLYRNILQRGWRLVGVSILLGYFAQKPMMRTLNLPVPGYSMLPIGTPGAREESEAKWNTSAWVTLMGPLLPGLLTCFFMQQSQGKTVACEEMSREPPKLQELFGKADDPITIVVVGLTGTGKSSLCGLLSQCSDCKEGNDFASVTSHVQSYPFQYKGRSYCIIDAPGFYDTAMTEEETLKSISKIAQQANKGIHAVLICAAQGRLTKENEQVLEWIELVVGKALGKYGMLVVTKTDKSGDNIKDSLLALPKDNFGHRIVEVVGERIMGVETKAWFRWTRRQRRANLLEQIISLVESNNYSAIDCDFLQFERIRQERERELQKLIQPLQEELERERKQNYAKDLENQKRISEVEERLARAGQELQEARDKYTSLMYDRYHILKRDRSVPGCLIL